MVSKAFEASTERRKALGESLFVDGGAIVPPAFVESIIEVLRSKDLGLISPTGS